jgi:hypothetical protein
MKSKLLFIFLLLAFLALPTLAMAKADLVIAVDTPPKSMNPHSYNSDANLSYMSNFLTDFCRETPLTENSSRPWPLNGNARMR